MTKKIIFTLAAFTIVLSGCQSKKKLPPPQKEEESEYLDIITTEKIDKPLESYGFTDEVLVETSVVNIPVRLGLRELEKMVNDEFNVVLEQNKSFEQEGYQVEIEKLNDIKIGIDNQRIKYLVPLKLKIQKNMGFATVKADAALAMQFFTDFDIKPDWTLSTVSSIESYQWLEQPKLRFGGVSIPAQFIGDMVIRQSKAVITKSIDEQIKENLNLRKVIDDAWVRLQVPIEVSKEYNSWAAIHPQSITATPLKTVSDAVVFTISVQSKPDITLGTKPSISRVTALPAFRFSNVPDQDFRVYLSTVVSYKQAEQLATQNLKGETFTSGKYKVTIEDISLYGQGEKLVIDTKLSGSYKGSVYLIGEPYYDTGKNRVDIKNLDYSLGTQNFLFKTAGWLMKSSMKNKIRENINFYVDYNLQAIKQQIQEQFTRYEIAPGIVLKGELKDLNITDVFLTRQGIRVQVGVQGNMNVGLEGIQMVNHSGR
jgi:hypothetical protein